MAQYPAIINVSTLDGTDGFKLVGEQAGDQAGIAVGAAGDLNGDGFSDLVVSAYDATHSGAYSGSAYVVFGGPAGGTASLALGSLDGSNGFRIDAAAAGHQLGTSVSSAGDVNGDGIDDLIVGASGSTPSAHQPGRAYVVFGTTDGFAAVLDPADLNGDNGFTLTGATAYDSVGASVDRVGDFNGDGVDDLVVGAPSSSPHGSQSGSAYVVFGSADGFSDNLDLSALDGDDGFRIDGSAAFNAIGGSVAGIGDFNGDGLEDLLIGAGSATGNANYSGAAFVVFGTAGSLPASLNVSSLDGSNGFRLPGAAMFDDFGGSVSGAGDVNGDGYADIIIGASQTDHNGSASGSAYVVFGKAGGFAADFDPATLDGSNGFRMDGLSAYDALGSVSSAGDVNGDGFDDVIVGARLSDRGGPDSGASYVVFGKASGFGATFDLSSLDGSNGFYIDVTGGSERLGGAVSSAGDINGDGLDDLIVGATYDSAGAKTGAAFVIYGRLPDTAVDREGTLVSQSLIGGGLDDRLMGRAGDDNLWGNGGADEIKGGNGDDTVVGGAGQDKLGGGAGADHFLFRDQGDSPDRAHADVIKDLDAGDVIDLSVIDADSATAGNQAFHLVTAFSGNAGELLLHLSGTGLNTWLEADTDGDGEADFMVKLRGDHSDFTNFVL